MTSSRDPWPGICHCGVGANSIEWTKPLSACEVLTGKSVRHRKEEDLIHI